MERGYLKLWRKSLDSEVFASESLWRLWSWCLMKTSYKIHHVSLSSGKGSIVVTIKPGQFIFGRHGAAEALGWNPSTTWKRMQKLVEFGCISIQSNNRYSVVTICNWEEYQEEKSIKEQQSDSRVTAGEQQSDTNKKVKKGKNEKNILGATKAPADFPVSEEMTLWVTGNTSFQGNVAYETEKFLDHFRAKGERKTDWLATWRNWMRRAGEFKTSRKGEFPATDGYAGSGKRLVI